MRSSPPWWVSKTCASSHYERRGPDVELMIEQVAGDVRCPICRARAQVKERPVVHLRRPPRLWHADVAGLEEAPDVLSRTRRCHQSGPGCSSDHRIAAKNCLLTTRAAKWATVQVGGGRTVSEVAAELSCDWHTVNDAVCTYGEALLAADRNA